MSALRLETMTYAYKRDSIQRERLLQKHFSQKAAKILQIVFVCTRSQLHITAWPQCLTYGLCYMAELWNMLVLSVWTTAHVCTTVRYTDHMCRLWYIELSV